MALGSIVVRLSMNTADFETDAGRASKTAERRAKEIDKSFRDAGKAIGLALGAGLAIATAAITKTIDRMDDMSKSAQRVGLPTEEFSRLAYAGELADVEMSTLVSTLGKLTKAQGMALDSTTDQAKVFDALGISVTDTTGKMRSSTDVLADFADRFKAMGGSQEAMAAGFQIFGRSFQDMIPLIKDGADGIRNAAEESDRLGKTLSTEAGQQAELFNDNLTRLKGSIFGATMEIVQGMLPALVQLSGDLDTAGGSTGRLTAAGQGLGSMLTGLGDAFGVVSRMARQFGVDMSTALDVASGFGKMAAGVATFGFTDMAAQGKAQIQSTLKARRELLAQFGKDDAKAKIEADIRRLSSGGVKYEGPMLEGGSQGAGTDYAARLRTALGPTVPAGKKSGASKKAELTDEQKALQKLNEEYAREIESRNERLGMMGLETEASRVLWETENGRWKDLDANQKAELIAAAGLEDVRRKLLDDIEKETRAREDAEEGYKRAIADIQTERDQLGMTNEQMEIYNRLKWAGVDANSEFGQSLIKEAELLQQQRQAMGDQIELMDGLRDSAKGFLSDLYEGVGVWDALKNAADNFADVLFDMASRKVIENLFGQMGSSGGGSAGGGWASLIGAFFGGGKASGGWTMPNTVYEVNERGMEMASVGGRDYMLTGDKPVHVTPNDRLRGGGRTISVTNNFHSPNLGTHQTQKQQAQRAGSAVQVAMASNR